MDNSSPSLREQGVQALREGNLDTAIDLLARAVMADARDAEAQAFLGVAYSQKGLAAQAIRALQTAVELQPGNASYEFNLGVALEHAGERTRAATAYREALQLNPEHTQARARLQTLSASAAAAPTPAPPAPPPASAPPAGAPWLAGQGQNLTTPLTGPPETVQCPQCKEWSKPGLSCEWCSASLRSGPSPAPPGTSAGGYGEVGQFRRAEYADRMDPVQGFRDWVQVLVSPSRFFAEQEGREGLMAPLGFLLVYAFLTVLVGLIALATGRYPGLPASFGGIGLVSGLVFGTLIGWILCMVIMFIWAGIVHGICKLFGGQAGYAGSFRAASYALAPLPLFGLVSSLITIAGGAPAFPALPPRGAALIAPGTAQARLTFARSSVLPAADGENRNRQPAALPGSVGFAILPAQGPGAFPQTGAAAISMLISLAGLVAYFVLLGVGTYHTHRLSSGAAAGAAVISGVVAIVVVVVVVVSLSVVFAALLVGLRGV